MLTHLRNVDLYAPEPQGPCDLLVGGGKILAVVRPGDAWPVGGGVEVEDFDAQGQRVIPGLIDPHVHVTGGGGESGPQSRVPPIAVSALTTAGITTCVGVLGTDGTTRSVEDLVARTLGLRAEGVSAYCYTGSYDVPPVTLTGSVRRDIAFVDPIIGVGEVAISDHRSSQPTFDEIVRIAADCHVGGLMTGKAGVLHLHMGDGPRGLELVRLALAETELPARTFYPTHVNRRAALWQEAMALAPRGVTVDVTAFEPDGDGLGAAEAIGAWLDAGLPASGLTCSSDGCGSLPVYDNQGTLLRMGVGEPKTVLSTLQELVRAGRPLEAVLPVFTQSTASLLRLHDKGQLRAGRDADLVVLDESSEPVHVMARGRWYVVAGEVRRAGMFEKDGVKS